MRKVEVYTDGSYDRQTGRCTGAYIVLEKDQIAFCGKVRLEAPEYKESWNVSAELMTALYAVLAIGYGLKGEELELTVVHDYIGICNYVSGPKPWRAKKLVPQLYTNGINAFKSQHPEITLKFRKVTGHSGDKYNEMADRLANGIVPAACKDKILEDVVLGR